MYYFGGGDSICDFIWTPRERERERMKILDEESSACDCGTEQLFSEMFWKYLKALIMNIVAPKPTIFFTWLRHLQDMSKTLKMAAPTPPLKGTETLMGKLKEVDAVASLR